MRPTEVQRAERAWFTRNRNGLDAAWVALVLLNVVAIAAWPSWATVPFHLIATGFAVLYGLRLWPAEPVLWGLGIVIITKFGGIGVDLLHDNESVEEAAEIPLLAAMFVAIVWLANRRIAADRERQLIGEKNSRLLEAQRRFLQDASHHLRTPITIALSHAELLAHVFDRFRTGHNANGTRGTGLGLALVRAVADAHGGSARVRSVPGEGSEFEITLPAG